MNLAYLLSGGAPVRLTFKIGATVADVGIPLIDTTADGTGIRNGTTTSAANAVGVGVDTGTYSTTQGATEGVVSVIVNPDAVWKIHAANSATAGTALVITTNITQSTTGLVVTKTGATGVGDPDPDSPGMDEGTIFCIGGANVGQSRKVTSVTATAATVIVPFLNNIEVGDVFVIVPWTPADVAGNNIQLTSNLTQARQDIVVGTGAQFRTVALEIDYSSQTQARNNTAVLAILDDHWLNTTT